MVIPADISDDVADKVREIAIRTYKIMECRGLSRIDFFVTDDDEIYLNEINTLPGFTSISMYPKLWGQSGIEYGTLLENLIELAMDLD